jgi:hypothetical protein
MATALAYRHFGIPEPGVDPQGRLFGGGPR